MSEARPARASRWWDFAACQGYWTLFDSTYVADHALAKRICRECPVFAECFAEVVRMRQERRPIHGTWAGTLFGSKGGGGTARPRHVAECGTDSGYYRHKRAGQDACEPCLRAHAVATSGRRDSKEKGSSTCETR